MTKDVCKKFTIEPSEESHLKIKKKCLKTSFFKEDVKKTVNLKRVVIRDIHRFVTRWQVAAESNQTFL